VNWVDYASNMNVFFDVQNGPFRGVASKRFQLRIHDLCALLKLQKKELAVVLTSDAHIHQLNREFRKKNKPTDVLAFATQEGEFAHLTPDALGDVVISVETAKRQAVAHAQPLLDELTMLAAHGILHLLGWDHQDDATERAMNQKTARLCAAVARAETLRDAAATISNVAARSTIRHATKPVKTKAAATPSGPTHRPTRLKQKKS
jgi:probable rRNA maturation factor